MPDPNPGKIPNKNILSRRAFIQLGLLATAAACTPRAVAQVVGTITPEAQGQKSPIPTLVNPNKTPAPSVKTIEVGGIQVPDPKVSNPELFDITKPSSPVVQFANAFGLKPENVTSGLKANLITPQGLPSFVTLRSADGIALMMAQQNTDTKEWGWQKAMPGTYWRAQGKLMGIYFHNTEELSNGFNFENFFKDGVLGLNSQVRPGGADHISERTPSNATNCFYIAQQADASLYFHYMAEPGKYPDNVTANNVDDWMSTRLQQTADLYIKYKTPGRPIYVDYNEPLEDHVGVWNHHEREPFFEKHGDKWLEDYTYLVLKTFTSKGLIPNKDFVMMINEGYPYDIPVIRFLHDQMFQARQKAFDRLTAEDPTFVQMMKVNQLTANDILYLYGAQTGKYAGKAELQSEEKFKVFADLGGVILTEVNPATSVEGEQIKFLQGQQKWLTSPYVKGLFIFNPFTRPQDGGIYDPTFPQVDLIDNGSPTPILYSLLK